MERLRAMELLLNAISEFETGGMDSDDIKTLLEMSNEEYEEIMYGQELWATGEIITDPSGEDHLLMM